MLRAARRVIRKNRSKSPGKVIPMKAAHLKSPGRVHEEYSYSSAADTYRNTEPAWRASRPRAGSLDDSLRPANFVAADPHVVKLLRDFGPPPTARGFDKLNDRLATGDGEAGILGEPPRRSSSREHLHGGSLERGARSSEEERLKQMYELEKAEGDPEQHSLAPAIPVSETHSDE